KRHPAAFHFGRSEFRLEDRSIEVGGVRDIVREDLEPVQSVLFHIGHRVFVSGSRPAWATASSQHLLLTALCQETFRRQRIRSHTMPRPPTPPAPNSSGVPQDQQLQPWFRSPRASS